MTETFRFFDLVSYTEADFAEYMQHVLRPTGIFFEIAGNALNVSCPGGMVVNVLDGEALVNGFWYRNSAALGVTIANNASGSTRVDTIVLKLDRAANTLQVATHVGTPGAGAPTLTQVVGGTWEFPICNVTVANGAASIVIGNITDRRVFSTWGDFALTTPNVNTRIAAYEAGLKCVAAANGVTSGGGGASAGVTNNVGFSAIVRQGVGSIQFTFSVARPNTTYIAIGNGTSVTWGITTITTGGFWLAFGSTDGAWSVAVFSVA